MTLEQQQIVYTLVLSLGKMNAKTSGNASDAELSKEESLSLFKELSGSIKGVKNIDARFFSKN